MEQIVITTVTGLELNALVILSTATGKLVMSQGRITAVDNQNRVLNRATDIQHHLDVIGFIDEEPIEGDFHPEENPELYNA